LEAVAAGFFHQHCIAIDTRRLSPILHLPVASYNRLSCCVSQIILPPAPVSENRDGISHGRTHVAAYSWPRDRRGAKLSRNYSHPARPVAHYIGIPVPLFARPRPSLPVPVCSRPTRTGLSPPTPVSVASAHCVPAPACVCAMSSAPSACRGAPAGSAINEKCQFSGLYP